MRRVRSGRHPDHCKRCKHMVVNNLVPLEPVQDLDWRLQELDAQHAAPQYRAGVPSLAERLAEGHETIILSSTACARLTALRERVARKSTGTQACSQ